MAPPAFAAGAETPASPGTAAARQAIEAWAAATRRADAGRWWPALQGRAARIEIEPEAADPRWRLAACTRVQAEAPAGPPTPRWRVALRCTEGATRWQVAWPVVMRVLAAAPVAAAPLAAGQPIGPDALHEAEVDWAALPRTAGATPVEPDAAAGRVLARAVPAGRPVLEADLLARRWFAAGDPVRVHAVGAGFSIDVGAFAIGEGIEGRPARVRLDSGRVLVGAAVGPGRVEVVW